ncbi:hypothetical protein N5079_08775 [Planotetraspora sp. A-T 1434]|uniref:hypothetical protein n=1 Tax=Planotetraspora sp. A-T 1434 TaxID=2979219 RepID=UPI0021C1FB14|nr:hypothetical protein [Planotetraspora sp. A-T 1434]MCT9930317.1 hypothetical protein [Planotetraspora sp. A-T 1434]
MKPTRRMLISTGVVGAVLVGGVSVAATASAGLLQKATMMTQQGSRHGQVTPASPGPVEITGTPTEVPGYDPSVVSKEINQDPDEVADYWTTEKMEGAEPMPMPQVSISIIGPGD